MTPPLPPVPSPWPPPPAPRLLVYVVESPSNRDILDGRTEGRVLTETLRISGVDAEHKLVTNNDTLTTALGVEMLGAALRSRPFCLPFLHWSGHGDSDGVGLTDGTHVPWHRLGSLLTPINKAVRGYLGLSMSSCFGYGACRSAMTESADLPFFALVGHNGQLSWSDGAIAFAVFYHRFSKNHQFFEAVEAMKCATGDPGFMFDFGPRLQKGWLEFLKREGPQGYRQALLDALGPDPSPDGSPASS